MKERERIYERGPGKGESRRRLEGDPERNEHEQTIGHLLNLLNVLSSSNCPMSFCRLKHIWRISMNELTSTHGCRMALNLSLTNMRPRKVPGTKGGIQFSHSSAEASQATHTKHKHKQSQTPLLFWESHFRAHSDLVSGFSYQSSHLFPTHSCLIPSIFVPVAFSFSLSSTHLHNNNAMYADVTAVL